MIRNKNHCFQKAVLAFLLMLIGIIDAASATADAEVAVEIVMAK